MRTASRINADAPYSGTDVAAAPPAAPSDLHNIFNRRTIYHGPKHATQDELVSVYNGEIPSEFGYMFHPEQRVHLVNMLRLSWDDLAGMTGQEFPLYSASDSETPTQKAKAEKRESICYGYNAAGRKRINGGPDMKALMGVLAWYLAGLGECVAGVLPDGPRKSPYFVYRDTRHHYPPPGFNPYEQQGLDNTLFAYRMTLAELKARFPEAADDLSETYTKRIIPMSGHTGWDPTYHLGISSGRGARDEEHIEVWVGEWYSKNAWYIATLEDKVVTLLGTEDGDRGFPGICPWVGMALFNPEQARSLLADQISIQVAESRMFSQQIDYYDRTLYAPIFGTKIKGQKVKYGPGAYNEFETKPGEKPAFFQANPQNPLHADQMMQFGISLLRMLNRNPESLQGGGDANSAKALSELKGAVTATVQNNFWPVFLMGLPQLYAKAIRLDLALWPNERKPFSGRTPDAHRAARGAPVSGSYRPLTDLLGYEDSIEIEITNALRGYEGLMEIMQLKGSGLLPIRMALEQMSNVRDAEAALRMLQSDNMEMLIWNDLNQKASQGQMVPGAMAKLRDEMQKEGKDLFDAIASLEESGELYIQAPAPGAAPGGSGGGPSPDMAGLMEALQGGGGGGGGPPALSLIQGGAGAG